MNFLGFEIPISASMFGGFIGLWGLFTWIVGFIILAAITGVISYLIFDRMSYKYKVEIYENIAGQGYMKTGNDVGKMVKLGNAGEMVLHLKKRKTYRSAYGKKMGINTFWFAIGQDGYWYNIILGDLDAKKGELDIEPIDRDMRYMHVAIRRNITDRYKKVSFMDKYGTWVLTIVFMFIMFGGLWFLIDKIAQVSVVSSSTMTTLTPILERLVSSMENIMSSMDNICSGGSGLVSA